MEDLLTTTAGVSFALNVVKQMDRWDSSDVLKLRIINGRLVPVLTIGDSWEFIEITEENYPLLLSTCEDLQALADAKPDIGHYALTCYDTLFHARLEGNTHVPDADFYMQRSTDLKALFEAARRE